MCCLLYTVYCALTFSTLPHPFRKRLRWGRIALIQVRPTLKPDRNCKHLQVKFRSQHCWLAIPPCLLLNHRKPHRNTQLMQLQSYVGSCLKSPRPRPKRSEVPVRFPLYSPFQVGESQPPPLPDTPPSPPSGKFPFPGPCPFPPPPPAFSFPARSLRFSLLCCFRSLALFVCGRAEADD